MKRILSIAIKVLINLAIILLVLLIPPLVYDYLINTKFGHNYPMIGGITYPLYISYLTLKLKNFRAKFIILHIIIVFISYILSIVFLDNIKNNYAQGLILPLTMLVVLYPLGMSYFFKKRGDILLSATCRISCLVALPFGIALTLLTLFSLSRSAMGGMRW
ncbi:MAG: hypothetical protein ABI410_13235 [Rhodoferax sp.]|uniref:hypothetical protein n=1 Tax=Rhodoferax sp. TaxID=50421 RepID=UPI0032656ED8